MDKVWRYDKYWTLCWFLTLLICRFIRSGRIAAGDLCPEAGAKPVEPVNEKEGCTSAKGYMPWTSNLILAWMVGTVIFLCVYVKMLGNMHSPTAAGGLTHPDYRAKYEHVG